MQFQSMPFGSKSSHQPPPSRARLRPAAVAVAALLLAAASGLLAGAAAAKASASGVVNVNTASAEELQLLPGVGAARAEAIIAVRQARGGFKAVDELTDVKGIGPAMLEKMRPHVTLSGRTTARSAKPAARAGRASSSAR
jgi:competence protein ComEA